jgi:hypothetical protein
VVEVARANDIAGAEDASAEDLRPQAAAVAKPIQNSFDGKRFQMAARFAEAKAFE